ncbi:MAG: C_GCAxxG_C_C family protein [Dehalococcoidales bacterium]|nr:C_GCAxxG_C_C family protein [Dehalococcoidales bacterium]
MSVLDHAYDHPLEAEEHTSGPLAGGLMLGYQCGMLWGSALAAGAQAYRLLGSGTQAQFGAVTAAQKIVESFRRRTGDKTDCFEIAGISSFKEKRQILKYFTSGGMVNCLGMAAGYPPEAFDAINSSLCGLSAEVPFPPLSCSAVLAQKTGMSEMHTIMAAGFAGGIGLSGGACGALGTAIWAIGIKGLRKGESRKITSSKINDIIERFSNGAGSRYRCREITGREFKDIKDHADYLRSGGCSTIIDLLALVQH